MIEAYKILTGKYDVEAVPHLVKVYESITRGNHLKLENCRARYDLLKFNFTNTIVNIWNSLPNYVVSADSVNTFKTRLDKFWTNQEIIYDYRAQIQGTGSRSKVVNV